MFCIETVSTAEALIRLGEVLISEMDFSVNLKIAVEYVILNWNYDKNYAAKERVYDE